MKITNTLTEYHLIKIEKHSTNLIRAKRDGDFEAFRYHKHQLIKAVKNLKKVG